MKPNGISYSYLIDPKIAKQTRVISILIGIGSLSLSGFFLGCWIFGDLQAKTWVTLLMKANSCFCFFLISVSFIWISTVKRTSRAYFVAHLFLVAALILSTAIFFEYLLGVNFYVDEFISKDVLNAESSLHPGRMSPNAAFSFVLLTLSMLLLDSKKRFGEILSQWLLLVTLVLGFAAEIGYLYGSSLLYKVSDFIRISPYTAGVFMALSIGVLILRPVSPPVKLLLSGGPEGFLARRLFPATILLPVIFCGIIDHLRTIDALDRATGYSLLAISFIIVFSLLILQSARAMLGHRAIGEESRAKLSAIVESSDDAVVGKDFNGIVTSWNKGAEIIFGYNAAEMIGQSIIKIIPEDRRHEEVTILSKMRAGERMEHFETQRQRKDGTLIDVSVTTSPIKDTLGNPIGISKIARNISIQKRVEEELRQAIETRDNFLSIASHELKTPITGMKLQIQLLLREMAKGSSEIHLDRFKNVLTLSDKSIDRLSRLIEDMLDITRIRTGRLALNLESFDMAELVKEVMNRFDAQFAEAKIKFKVDVTGVTNGTWDRYRLDQVVTNLATNVLRYAPGHPVAITIHGGDQKVQIDFRDYGPGIAKENQDKIFERFERLVSANEISGLGIGLYIVRQILAAHGGKIAVESELGKGTCFKIEVPTDLSADTAASFSPRAET